MYKIYAGRLNYDLGYYSDAVRDMKAAYDLDADFTNTQGMYLIYVNTPPSKKVASKGEHSPLQESFCFIAPANARQLHRHTGAFHT